MDNHHVVDLDPDTYRVRAVSRADDNNWMILVSINRCHERGRTSAAKATVALIHR